jgi:hypothetical protein
MKYWYTRCSMAFRMQSSWRLPSGRDASDARKPSGDFSDVGWFAFMSALVVLVTMLMGALGVGPTP